MPRLSIIIPVLGDPQQLDDTLLSVLENRPANCEIIVVHNEPYCDPYHLSDEVRFVEAGRGASMVECLNLGLAASLSPIVNVLACGVEVTAGWANVALRQFGKQDVAATAAVVLDRYDQEKIVSAGWGYRPEGTAWRLGRDYEPSKILACRQDFCGPDMLAAFYRKSAVEAVGGFSTRLGDELAGIDVALLLRCAGFRCALEPQCVAYINAAVIRAESAFCCGLHAERLFWRWASSRGLLTALMGHAALLAGECVIGLWRPSRLFRLAGRAWGLLPAMFAHRPRESSREAVAAPVVFALPQSSTAHPGKKQRTSRVA